MFPENVWSLYLIVYNTHLLRDKDIIKNPMILEQNHEDSNAVYECKYSTTIFPRCFCVPVQLKPSLI